MNNDYIYRSFTKAELVQRCIDFGINRVAMLAERSRLREELAECKRDAERYRWLRDPDCDQWSLPSRFSGDELDREIDRAMPLAGKE